MAAISRRARIWIALWAIVALTSVLGHSWSWWLARDLRRFKAGELTVAEVVKSPDSDHLGTSLDGQNVRVLTWHDPVSGESHVANLDPVTGKLLWLGTWSGGGWLSLLFRVSVYVVVFGAAYLTVTLWNRVRARHRAHGH